MERQALMGISDNPILTANQKAFLARFAVSRLHEAFYLAGGTALSAFYLQHRSSEDLDFLTEGDFAIEDVLEFVKSLPGVRDSHYERKYDRRIFLLNYGNVQAMKVEFTRYPFTRLEAGPVIGGINVDSLKDILVNKLMAMTDRTDPKDYVDIYCALSDHPELKLDELVDTTAIKFGVKGARLILSGRFLQPLPNIGILTMRRLLDQADMAQFYSQHAKAWIKRSKESLD